jgi:RHS repeat-associated protein
VVTDNPTGYPFGALYTQTLQQGSNAALVNRTVGCDPVGNLTSLADSVTSYHGTSYAYDANGNMTTRGAESVVYDAPNRPVRIDSGSTIARLAYDGDGVRRKRLDANGTIYYLGAYERNLGGNGLGAMDVVTKYYTADLGNRRRLIAFRKGGTLSFVGTDHLGGTIRVTDTSFNTLDGMRYTPFGISRDAGTNLNSDHRYTSQVQDLAVGLYWYGSRAYDPVIGRFCAPDTIVPSPMNPQALNRYAYGVNEPLRLVDPTGHDTWDPNWVAAFKDAHNGQAPNQQNWKDYQFSLTHPGSGPKGIWTNNDWKLYTILK